MPQFSNTSLSRLAQCDPALQRLFEDVIQRQDCAILVGHRCEADQATACKEAKSKTPWPTSKHNSQPSHAVDAAPYPIDWDNIQAFQLFGQFVKLRAQALGISIVWGGDFKSWKDWDHFELAETIDG